MTDRAGAYAGLDRYACRRSAVDALEQAGLLVEIEEHEHAVPHHDRCGTIIEPLPMEQWFMDMKPLAQQTLPYLQRGDIEYVPERFRTYAVEWLENIREEARREPNFRGWQPEAGFAHRERYRLRGL